MSTKNTTPGLFKAILARDAFETTSKAFPKKDASAPDDEEEETDDVSARGADDKKRVPPWLKRAKKSIDEAEKALITSKSMRKAMSTLPMVDHPRPAVGGASGAATQGGDPSKENVTTLPMVSHARPGGGAQMDVGMSKARAKVEAEAGENDEIAMKALSAAREAIEKAIEQLGDGLGESGGETGATRTSAEIGRTDSSSPGRFPPQPHHGMPAAPAVAEHQLSPDDASISAQPGADNPFAPGAAGGAGLESSVHAVHGGAASSGSGDMIKGPSGFDGTVVRSGRGGALGMPAVFEVAQRNAKSFVSTFSTDADKHIDGLMKKSYAAGRGGHVLGEPEMNFQLGMLQTQQCRFCKSTVSALLSSCSECGGDHSGAHPTPMVQMDKSLRVRPPPTPTRVYAPDGFDVE